MPAATCSIKGCGRPTLARGWCRFHYDKWRRRDTPDAPHVVSHKCRVDGCVRTTRVEYCRLHRERFQRTGDPGPPGLLYERGKRRVCQVDRCEQPAHGKGMCWAHYARVRRFGEPGHAAINVKVVNAGKDCLIEGCDRAARAREMCRRHYRQELRAARRVERDALPPSRVQSGA